MPLDAARWQIDILAADKTAQAFASVDRNMRTLERGTQAVGSGMSSAFGLAARALGPLAAALSAAAVAQKVWTAGMAAGELKSQAEQIGLTTDQLQAYRLVAAQSGVSTEQLDAAMMSLTRQMGAAMGGSDEVIQRFDRLGVKILDSQGQLRKASDVAPELARGLLAMGSETERSATMMELFGRSGSRMVTILGEMARGNDALVQSAREQKALIGGEVIAAWDSLSSQLNVAGQRLDTLLATAGKPIADGFIFTLNHQLGLMVGALDMAKRGWDWLANNSGVSQGTTSSEDLIKRREAMEAWIEVNRESTDALDVAKLQNYRTEIQRINDALASRAVILPQVTVTGSAGAGNPVGRAAQGAADKGAAERLRETQRQMDELFASIEKVRQDSIGVLDRYGDGSAYAARETERLNDMLRMGFIDAETHGRAIEDVTRKADEMNRAYRGATGGVEGFLAGIEQGIADMDRANSAFEVGRRSLDLIGDGMDILAGKSNRTFEQIAGDFALMLAKMAAQAAVSDIFKGVFGGGGGGGGGFLSGIGGWLGGLFGGGGGGGGFAGDAMTGAFFADGGDYRAGQPRIVGEKGWELDIPRSGGTIYNQKQLAAMLGGGSSGGQIVIHQTVQVGSVVSQAQHEADLRAVKQAAMDGAKAGLLEDIKAGGSTRRIVRG